MTTETIPALIAGPIVRHVSENRFTLWLVTAQRYRMVLTLSQADNILFAQEVDQYTTTVQVGKHCFIHLIAVTLEQSLPTGKRLDYDLHLSTPEGSQSLQQLAPQLCYADRPCPAFRYKPTIEQLLHGSCRNPHYPADDALPLADRLIEQGLQQEQDYPSMLMMTGDQIYADDVAGPMLVAIHQVIHKLELFNEQIPAALICDSLSLMKSDRCYYGRDQILPHQKANQDLVDKFFGGIRKPIFTSVCAHNHLITLSEVIAMYLLCWSDTPWQWTDMSLNPQCIPARQHARYRRERHWIEHFRDQLPQVRRALAHIPVYMIFDDHDVTDDWNLTRGWEEAAYHHPFSRRVIGNALIGYWLCQGSGNQPESMHPLYEQTRSHFSSHGIEQHDQLVDKLLQWSDWDFQLQTDPHVIVLDSRTRRWRSESSPNRPSGLMDWESLCKLQQQLINQNEVILISPAPVFGVKMIEAVQRVFTFFGKPLTVDAENWMAHPGAANVILNIFKHQQTPQTFIILSGDVHYSFAYDITLRHRNNSPEILQITASGFKNMFPRRLLSLFDRLDQLFYGVYSPFNWFTKRRQMQIRRRRPRSAPKRTLFNSNGIGRLVLRQAKGKRRVELLTHQGKCIEFVRHDQPPTHESTN